MSDNKNEEIEQAELPVIPRFLTAESIEELRNNIVKIIVEQKKYLQNNYGAKDLCKELGVQPRYVSAVIRIALKTNYSGLINSHRIAMACDYLMDAQYARLTMEEIGLLVGYESRQAFYLAFKKIQKMSPRRYQETRRTKGIVDNEK